MFVLFNIVRIVRIVRSALIRARSRRFDEDDKSTVGVLGRILRGFCEDDSRGTANDR
jgi:hypothetical protein